MTQVTGQSVQTCFLAQLLLTFWKSRNSYILTPECTPDLFLVRGSKPGIDFEADITVNGRCNLTSGTLTLAAPLLIFNVTTIEIFGGKSSQFASSWEGAKFMEVWGPEKCTPLTPMACFTCTFGASLEGSFSRTKERRSRGIKSEISHKQLDCDDFHCKNFSMCVLENF